MMDADDLANENLFDLVIPDPLDSSDSSARNGDLLEIEAAHNRIEERVRRLENLIREQIQLRNRPQIHNLSTEITVNNNSDTAEETPNSEQDWRTYGYKLVESALEMDSDVKTVEKENGSYYDCSICLDLAKNPILTCCGHLFCWACFYQVEYVDSSTKECPVCKGEVSNNTVTPIYGNGGSDKVTCSVTDSGLKIPPRPKAHRVESVRQQRISRGLSPVPEEAQIQQIRVRIVDQMLQQGILSFEREARERQQNAEVVVSSTQSPEVSVPAVGIQLRRSSRRINSQAAPPPSPPPAAVSTSSRRRRAVSGSHDSHVGSRRRLN